MFHGSLHDFLVTSDLTKTGSIQKGDSRPLVSRSYRTWPSLVGKYTLPYSIAMVLW